MARNRHWLYDAYLALADTNSMTEPEGRATLKELYPHLAFAVDSIVDSGGDMVVAKQAEAASVGQAISDQLRARYRNMRSASIGPIGQPKPEGQSAAEGGDFGAMVRQQLRGTRITESG